VNFYKHFIGDFQRDTGHLSLTERGAYRALLDHFYATERPLPTDMTQLARLVGAASKADRDAIKRVLAEFWALEQDGWTNARAKLEIAKADEQRGTNRRIAVEREAKRKAPYSEHEPSTSRATNRSTNASPLQTPDSRLQTDIPNHPPSSLCVISTFPGAKIARAEDDERREIEALKAQYPPHSGRTDWITAEHHIRRQIERGATWQQMHEGVERYVRLVTATNRMVLNPARFFGDPDAPWSQPWPLPPTKSVAAQSSNIAAAQAWLAGDGNAAQ
jgi:uncharacterized protein YdaU (DUF1376 family)